MGSKYFNFTGLELSLDDNSVLSKPNGKPADMSAAVPATLKDGIVFVEVKNLADVIVLEVPENASIHMYVLHDAYANLIYVGSGKKNIQAVAAMLESEKRWHLKHEYTVIAHWSTSFWEAVQRRFAVKPEGFAAPKPDKPAAKPEGKPATVKLVIHHDATAGTETAVGVEIREQGKTLAERIAARAAEHAQEAPKKKAPATEEKPKASAADFFKGRHHKS